MVHTSTREHTHTYVRVCTHTQNERVWSNRRILHPDSTVQGHCMETSSSVDRRQEGVQDECKNEGGLKSTWTLWG